MIIAGNLLGNNLYIASGSGGQPMVSPEALTVVNLPSVDSPEGMNVTVTGKTSATLDGGPSVKVTSKASTQVESNGITQVKGTLLKLN